MQITIHGKQIDVGDALREHVESRLGAATSKYFDRAVDAQVTFSREGASFKADATVHLPTGLNAHTAAVEPEIYAAFDACLERLDKQLRRYKRRLKDHSVRRSEPVAALAASAYVLKGGGHHEDAEPDTLDPVIVAEMTTDIKTLSVGEAVMQMELTHATFLLFRNELHEGLNVVYRRDDGNIGWIDPAGVSAVSA